MIPLVMYQSILISWTQVDQGIVFQYGSSIIWSPSEHQLTDLHLMLHREPDGDPIFAF